MGDLFTDHGAWDDRPRPVDPRLSKLAQEAVTDLLEEISDMSGVRKAWAKIDPETLEQIRTRWTETVLRRVTAAADIGKKSMGAW